jgi:hypothetical protein
MISTRLEVGCTSEQYDNACIKLKISFNILKHEALDLTKSHPLAHVKD